ncbi:transposase [Isoalcanivorax beigongshangi]|uniref:Transposase n=1 Tax=Isoalcanivorax beigongshangi TaxID=3238810 RepID=A0ABV4AGH3_9GAMM
MPRERRQFSASYSHYIHNVSRPHRQLFEEDIDYRAFLRTLGTLRQEYRIDLCGWCLLPTEMHLVIQLPDPAELSVIMKRLSTLYTGYVNRKRRQTGSLWHGRYRYQNLDTPLEHLYRIAAIESLPTRRGHTHGPHQYIWSSYRERTNLVIGKALCRDDAFSAMAPSAEERRELWRNMVAGTLSVEERERMAARVGR